MPDTNLLDQAWENINSLGGAPTDEYERGFNDAIGEALEVIEKMGGMNPDIRSASPAVQKAYKFFRKKCAEYDAETDKTCMCGSPMIGPRCTNHKSDLPVLSVAKARSR